MTKFEVGQTYTTRSAVDYDTIFTWKVIARTDKILTLERHDKKRKCKVRIYNDIESCLPDGYYSMCPVLFAA